MAKEIGRYDSSLQMFVEAPREADMSRLYFLRWLAENNKLEHRTFGPSSGEFTKLPSMSMTLAAAPAA